jgi:hypothetical protein
MMVVIKTSFLQLAADVLVDLVAFPKRGVRYETHRYANIANGFADLLTHRADVFPRMRAEKFALRQSYKVELVFASC